MIFYYYPTKQKGIKMVMIDENLGDRIVTMACSYLGREFDKKNFNCVHFVREVYRRVGIELPLLEKNTLPPNGFHLTLEEFDQMPIGRTVFFKRKDSKLRRLWTHVAIVAGEGGLIHCTRHLGCCGVVITPKPEFMEVYTLPPIS